MPDTRIPDDVVTWISARNWGDHHDEWHSVRRWDIYHRFAELAEAGDNRFTWAIDVVAYIRRRGWRRASAQEGTPGNGMEFLVMHRAMLELLVESLPQHSAIFEGWQTPPTNPIDPDDPVEGGAAFSPDFLSAISRIERDHAGFNTEDDYGTYIEASLRPTPTDPFATSSDPSTGIHNYLHGRWTDPESDINLGDPTVNIYNARFWSLHGWIDRMWRLFREAKGIEDTEEYQNMMAHHKHMMNMPQPMHEVLIVPIDGVRRTQVDRPLGLNKAFVDSFIE